MKSLYESIIGNTKIGKSKPIDDKYLLDNGFALRNDMYGWQIKGELYYYAETYNTIRKLIDKNKTEYFVIDVLTSKHFIETKIIKTIGDLDIVINWWKAHKEKNKKEEKHLLKEIEKFETIF